MHGVVKLPVIITSKLHAALISDLSCVSEELGVNYKGVCIKKT